MVDPSALLRLYLTCNRNMAKLRYITHSTWRPECIRGTIAMLLGEPTTFVECGAPKR